MNLSTSELKKLCNFLLAVSRAEDSAHLLGSNDNDDNHYALVLKNNAQEAYKRTPSRIIEAAGKIVNPYRIDTVCKEIR